MFWRLLERLWSTVDILIGKANVRNRRGRTGGCWITCDAIWEGSVHSTGGEGGWTIDSGLVGAINTF